MRRPITGLLAAGAVAALALTGCSSGAAAPASTPAATTSGSGAASASTVLSAANIASVIASYTGEDSRLPTTFGTPTPKPLKIGWAEARDANELNNRLSYAIQKTVAKMGGTLVTLDANGDPGKQVTQIQQLVNEKVDGIIVWPLDATALVPALNQAKAAGIPITAMEVTPNGAGDLGAVNGQVIYGRDIDAFLSAKLMSQLHPGAQVATNKFAVPVPSISYYAQRAAYWAEQDGLTVVGTYDNPSDDVTGGQSMSGPVLGKYPDVKGWLAYNDASALGVSAGARTGSKTVSAFGQNGEDATIAAIRSGQVDLSIQPPADKWAEELLGGILLAKSGTTIPQSIFVGVGDVMTKETVANSKPLKSIIDSTFGG